MDMTPEDLAREVNEVLEEEDLSDLIKCSVTSENSIALEGRDYGADLVMILVNMGITSWAFQEDQYVLSSSKLERIKRRWQVPETHPPRISMTQAVVDVHDLLAEVEILRATVRALEVPPTGGLIWDS